MNSRSRCGKDESVLKNLIQQKPVSLYMAFPEVIQVSCQLFEILGIPGVKAGEVLNLRNVRKINVLAQFSHSFSGKGFFVHNKMLPLPWLSAGKK